jgi:putative ABC transport system ATP-binding protein
MHAVSKTYRTARETTSVLEALDLELPRGEITCLVGPSGCGKSTLVPLIAGLLVPDSGQVIFDGQDIGALSDTRRAQLRATRIGIVLQSGNLVPFLTAGENITLAIRLAGRTARAGHIHALLEQVDLEDRAGTCRADSPAARRSASPWHLRWRTTPSCFWPMRPLGSSTEPPPKL